MDRRLIVLCLNSGSSSLKFALFSVGAMTEERLADGEIDFGETEHGEPDLDAVAKFIEQRGLKEISAIGHRIVHGGPDHVAPTLVDDQMLSSLERVVPLAPLHLPAALRTIRAAGRRWPSCPQIACFDTAFHATLPEHVRRLPLPERFPEARKYGFHGLSYEYVLSALAPDVPPRLIIAHLGNGASLVAVLNGRSIDTTMGLTPAGGVMMGTRPGDIDPGVLVYLGRQYGLSADELEGIINRESGLRAVAGHSDMRRLLTAQTDGRARLATEMFCYSVRKAIGSLIAVLGGLDMLVFTGGIGEHAAPIREGACRGLESFGVVLDPQQNAGGRGTISSDSSRVAVRVIPTDEDRMIARHVGRLVRR